MSDEVKVAQEKDAARRQLRLILAKVPTAVINGSYQTAVAYKKWHATAIKVLNSDRATLPQIREAINKARDFL